jgi:transposase-like protein
MTSTTSLIPATEATAPSLIKTDARGRMQRTPEQRERILDEYERSGLSGPKFAALCGVKYQTLAGWWARRKSQRQAHPKSQPQRKAVSPVRWLEASVQPAVASTHGLLLELPGGVRAHLSNAGHVPLVAALVRALEKPC